MTTVAWLASPGWLAWTTASLVMVSPVVATPVMASPATRALRAAAPLAATVAAPPGAAPAATPVSDADPAASTGTPKRSMWIRVLCDAGGE